MKTSYLAFLLIPFFSFTQKTISVNHKKENLKSYPESKINIGGSRDIIMIMYLSLKWIYIWQRERL